MNLTQAQIDLVKNRVFAATDKDAARQMNISEKAFKGRKERALIALGVTPLWSWLIEQGN